MSTLCFTATNFKIFIGILCDRTTESISEKWNEYDTWLAIVFTNSITYLFYVPISLIVISTVVVCRLGAVCVFCAVFLSSYSGCDWQVLLRSCCSSVSNQPGL
ncbi:hypothetical protein XENOCAPTIV_009386 [Xenoophorus captivus]|uniref:Uncharacterized protein n=1 Tax=Xenoophorus captivus TaxID=1517983 RepID=A0ABV0QHF4_9TELE